MRMILRLVLLASQILYICGKVILLRGIVSGERGSEKVENLICLSEDDGGALVWNTNIDLKYLNYSTNNRFHNVDVADDNGVNCKMNEDTDCLQSWSRRNWNLTNSVETPMGPVFDQRWEEFQEYSNIGDLFDLVNLKRQIPSAGALSFSTRAPSDVHVLFCNTKEYEKSACFWVIIGGWNNNKSAIRKCMGGVPNTSPKKAPTDKDCRAIQDSHEHTPLSEIEWQTFVITWNFTERSRNISVYNTDSRVLTYGETANYNFHFLDFNFIFIKTKSSMLFRAHEYDFLHTSTEDAILMSPIYLFSNSTICIQVLIGLCTECDADVVMTLYSFNHKEIIDNITARGSLNAANLPMWQLVKLNKTFSTVGRRDVIIQVIPKLRAPTHSPLWAIADVRQCSKRESLRRGNIHNLKGEKVYDTYWHSNWVFPHVTCQKLLYNELTVVSSVPEAKQNVELDEKNCPVGKIGPKCLFSCERDLNSNIDCKGTAICYKNGCTCSPGYRTNQCSENCDHNSYGYNCKHKCGRCKTEYYTCNHITGACLGGCATNSKDIYIPPLCDIGIPKHLEAPSFVFTSKTSIRTELPFPWKEEYEQLTISYSFLLKENETLYRKTPSVYLFSNMTLMTGEFENLKPGSYSLLCILSVPENEIHSAEKNVEIDCDLAKQFNITPAENSITVDIQINSDQLYPCPPNWYSLTIQDISRKQTFFPEISTKFPRVISGLLPYTLYNIEIYTKHNRFLFSKEVRTLEGVPSQVIDVVCSTDSDTVTLSWRPPDYPNGEIMYEVTVKVKENHGCKVLNLPTPTFPVIQNFTGETNIKVSDLHSYTSYSAQVIVHNSRHKSNSTDILFSTKEAETPIETFADLKVHRWILSWQPPTNCSTISGQLMAAITITGVSKYVKNYSVSVQTNKTYYDLSTLNPVLNGVEQYKTTVYVIRHYNGPKNSSAYQELYFETPPTAPPEVTNLEVVEIDDRVPSDMMLYLKWQSPRPPLHGKLHYYSVTLCYNNKNECSSKRVELSNSCDLWDGYICEKFPISQLTNLDIQVFAYNEHVTTSSPPVDVPRNMFQHTKPDTPEKFIFELNKNSVVDLQWRHPQKTGRHLRCFSVTINEKTSNLRTKHDVRLTDIRDTREYLVEQYTRYYRESLHLYPSTKYNISLQAVTTTGEKSIPTTLELVTPSDITFNGDLQVMEENSNSMIILHIPPIVNDTLLSIMHIIVKGPDRCKEYSEVPEDLQKEANVKIYEIAWHAAVISTDEIARRNYTFVLGDNKSYGNVRNCPLYPKQHYEVIVIVKDLSSTFLNSSKSLMLTKAISIGEVPVHHEAWLIPLILLLSVVISVAGYFIYRRRNQQSEGQIHHDEMILSENIENYELEAKSVISDSKQDITTPLDKQSLSRATTPEEPSTIIKLDDEKTLSVKVKEFEDYIREAIQSGLLDKQYETFPRGQTRPWDYGKLPQNKAKNRYANLIAYDETRVILNKLPDDDYSDYINANYITGYKKQKHYIAAQGPKPNTVVDFWRMIWQENVLIICMMANVTENGKTKCEQYWPDIGKKMKYGNIVVLNAKHSVFADYCYRTFHVTCRKETRKIEHLHYTAWPDHGVPMYTHSVVTYLKKLLATPPGIGPVVVHCSAGVGRTGTIILCDICLHQAATEGEVDVFAATASIRNERVNMVDNKQQYLLAHLALMECLLSIPTTLPCDESLPARIKELKAKLPALQQRLQNTAWQDEALRPVTSTPSLSERNRAKNRFPELISDKVSRIYLKRYPTADEDSDYLSAVYVDGVKLQNQYLATQLPMPSTITDFWRMVAEFKVELVLMLQPPDPEDPTCCAIVPADGEFKPTPYLKITTKHTVELEYYASKQLFLIDTSEKPPRKQSVTILCLTEWKPGRNQPPPPVMAMVSFWQAAERIPRGDGPIVTLCHDGVTGTGLYLALSFVLERMTVERECDVCLAVRAVRRSRPDFVQSLEHLEYLCDAVTTYLEYFETYANFT